MNKENQFDPLRAILNQIKIDETLIRQFIEQQIENGHKKKGAKEFSKEVIRRLRIQNRKLQEQIVSLKKQLLDSKEDKNQVKTKLNFLLKLNSSLAQALGSCNRCWGEDPGCPVCSGEGYPGWRKLDIRLFNLYVRPSLEKIVGLNNPK